MRNRRWLVLLVAGALAMLASVSANATIAPDAIAPMEVQTVGPVVPDVAVTPTLTIAPKVEAVASPAPVLVAMTEPVVEQTIEPADPPTPPTLEPVVEPTVPATTLLPIDVVLPDDYVPCPRADGSLEGCYCADLDPNDGIDFCTP